MDPRSSSNRRFGEFADRTMTESCDTGRRAWSFRVFLTCWLVYCAFWTPYIVREHFPALAVAEGGSLNVERYLGWTEDIFPGPKGGAFINNNPGASLTAALPLVLLRPLLTRVDAWNRTLPRPARRPDDGEVFGRTLDEGRAFYFLLIGFLTVALVMAPITAATAAFLCSRLIEAGVPHVAAAQTALLCWLGTPILFRTAHLNHNLLVCDAGFAALLLLWGHKGHAPRRAAPENGDAARPRTGSAPTRTPGSLRATVAGLLAGYTVLCDYSGVVVVGVSGLYVLLLSANLPGRERTRIAACYTAGVIPGVLCLALYQTWAFGSFYHPSQHYMTPTAPTSHGYRGIDWPSPALAWANFFDPRFGLFAYCPALLLAFLVPFQEHRARRRAAEAHPVTSTPTAGTTRIPQERTGLDARRQTTREQPSGDVHPTDGASAQPYRLPSPEMWLLFVYFGLFVLFCAANQYSWLQPLTGFRYLVPVVPGLALLAVQAVQGLPSLVRQIIAVVTLAQSLLMAASHENDIRLASAIWHRHFELVWMLRAARAGAPVTLWWTPAIFLALALALALIWFAPTQRWRGFGQAKLATECEDSPAGPVD